MTRFKKIISLVLLVLLFIVYFIYSRPTTIRGILGLSKDFISTDNYIHITKWNQSKPDVNNINLSAEEFKEIIENFDGFKVRRTFSKYYHSSSTGEFYFIDFEYSLNDDGNKSFRITSDGIIKVNGKSYKLIEDEDAWVGMIQKIYNTTLDF